MQYNLCDIHFHTNMSFDAYENVNGNILKYDIDNIVDNYINKSTDEVNQVKLICMTDHNIFDYKNYLQQKDKFEKKGIYLLPGIEVKCNDKIHWVIVFNDLNLNKNQNGEKLEQMIRKFYKYNDTDDIFIQTKKAQEQNIDIIEFVKEILNLKIEFLAIPHMDKSNGWHNVLKKFPEQNKILNYLICDGIINGFESKKMENSIIDKIKETCNYLEKHSDELDDLNEKILRLNDLNDLSNEYNKLNDEITKKNSEILKEKKYLEIVAELQRIIDENEVPNIYGSDFHGKNGGNYPIDNLFYIKSECTFEGLKFALLDCESRIFSKQRYNKYNKSNNYVIKGINLKIDGKDKKICLGDGLNSIIGSRGTGKSFLLCKLLGNKGYENSIINNQIKLQNIEFLNHSPANKLIENNYTYIGQKSNISSQENKNIYDLLAEAPYDYRKFEESLKKIYKKNNETFLERNIEDMISKCNELIDWYISVEKERTKKYDFSYIDDYNEFYSETNDDVLIYSLFEKAKNKLKNDEKEIKNKICKIDYALVDLDKLKNNLTEIFQYEESKALLKDNLLYNDNLKSFNELMKILEDVAKPALKRREEINDKMQEANRKILNKLTGEATNSQNILSDYIKNLTNDVSSIVDTLKKIHESEEYINQKIMRPIYNEEKYIFETSSSKLELLLKKEIFFDKLSDEQISEMFENYKTSKYSSKIFLKIFELNNYGKNYIKNLYYRKDLRRSTCHLLMPNIEPEVLLKRDDGDYLKWDEQSPGQRSDIILSFVLEGNTSKILIIDQPEDDLDNETIFNKIVQLIRKIKLNRQVIIVTHNANLAITGDSDRLIICQNDNNKYGIICDSMESTKLYNYKSLNSSIKNQTVLKIGCEILEGGVKALKQRVNKIGYRQLFFKGE